MSWKCDVCDSYQEDGAILCEVCGAERSRESILEAERVAREERRLRRFGRAFKTFDVTGKVLFIIGVSVASLAFVCGLIILIIGGNFGKIINSAFSVGGAALENIKAVILWNTPYVLGALFAENDSAVLSNLVAIFTVMIGNIGVSFEILKEIFGVNAKNALRDCYIYCVVPLSESVMEHIRTLAESIGMIIKRAVESISNAIRGFS